MRRHHSPLIFLCVISLLFAACSGYEKVMKSSDVNYKLSKANQYYDKKDYLKANTVYESLLPVMKGTRNFEPLYFRFAYSSFYLKDYLAASYHFKNFTDYFPASKDAEEAEYLHALCLYKLAPKAALEQTNSFKAMEAMQSYINTHPESKRLAEANGVMEELRKKLETKEAGAARLYYNIGQYKAAAISYKTVIVNFPESPNVDYYQYMVMRSYYKYAKASIAEKQEERFVSASNAYQDLKESFPSSKYLAEAERLLTQVNNNIKKIRHEHQ